MVSLFTEPEPCLLRRAGISSHNRALDSLSLETELHGDALVQPFYSFCPGLGKIAAAGALPLPVLKHCHLVVAVALLERVVAGLPTLDKVLDLQAFLVLG